MYRDLQMHSYDLERIEQLEALTSPIRYRMIILITREPKTAAQLARELGMARPKAHYHLKQLEKVGLARLVDESLVNGIVEKRYLSIARSYSFQTLIQQADRMEGGEDFRRRVLRLKDRMRVNMLDLARERIDSARQVQRLDLETDLDFSPRLTLEQVEEIRDEFNRLSDKIHAMTAGNFQREDYYSLPLYRLTFVFFSEPDRIILPGDYIPGKAPDEEGSL